MQAKPHDREEPVAWPLLEAINQKPPYGTEVVAVFQQVDTMCWRAGRLERAGEACPRASDPGYCEVVVRGRVGRVVDVASQSDWPVVLAVTPLAVSPRGASFWYAMEVDG